ncbi:MAG: transcriptional regulator [Bacteroidota bacterium]
MSRSKKLSLLLAELRRGRTLTITEIQALCGVSRRTVQRYLSDLTEGGVPIRHRPAAGARADRESRKVFYLDPEHHVATVGALSFSEEETLALTAAAAAADAVLGRTPLAVPAREALARLLRPLTPRLVYFDLEEQPGRWYIQAIAQTRMNPEVFQTVLRALAQNQRLAITYRKRRHLVQKREVEPLCLWVRNQAVLLTARPVPADTERPYRHLSMARLEAASPCAHAHFERPASFDPDQIYRADEHGVVTEGEVETFRIAAAPDIAHYFEERDYRPMQMIEGEREDGWLIVSWEGGGFEEWRSFFQEWGSKIEVLEPVSMRKRLAEEARVVLARYA